MVELRISPLRPDARIPTRMSDGGAGYDLYAAQDAEVPAASTTSTGGVNVGRCLVPVGFAIELPAGTVGRVAARSGLSVKFNLEVGAGWVDSDYRGEVMVELKNLSSTAYKINQGDRIAQLIILPIVQADLVVVDELGGTSRGGSGFGSTGVR